VATAATKQPIPLPLPRRPQMNWGQQDHHRNLSIQFTIESAMLHALAIAVVVTMQILPHTMHVSPVAFRALATRPARFCFFSSSDKGGAYDIGFKG